MSRNSLRGRPSASYVKPKLLLVGEGPNDVGRDDSPGGALAGFLTAAMTGPGESKERFNLPFEIAEIRHWISGAQLQSAPGRKRSTFDAIMKKLKPDTRRAQAFILIAAQRELDGVVVMRDCERRGNIELGLELRSAREAFDERAITGQTRPACVIAAPSRCHETWLLADAQAVESVLDAKAAFQFAGDAEERPNADTLKGHLKSHSRRLHHAEVDVRRELAFRASPSALTVRCAKCYPPFLADVDVEIRRRLLQGGSSELQP